MKILLILTGAAAGLYGSAVLAILGTGGLFNFFYLALGILLVAVGLLWKNGESGKRPWQKGFLIAAGVAGIVFLSVEAAIVGCSLEPAPPGADYVVLLGTQYRTDGPSVDYRARLMSAYGYLTDNPESMLIATGGKGSNEPFSEAEGARRFLTALGIPEERILIEDRSRNTVQNIQYAYDLLDGEGADPENSSIVIVSASYHLLRARFIAEKTGFTDVGVKGSTGLLILMPHFYTREFFALTKDFCLFLFK